MSAKTDYVRGAVEAFNRRDFEAMLEGLPEDYEWVTIKEHPQAATHRGSDEILAYFRDWMSVMHDMRFEIVEMEEHGDQVLTRMRIRGGPAGGQTGMEVGVSSVTTFRGDVPARNEEFLDADEARRALVSPR